MRRGEVWWASLPEPKGSEPGYRRPVVIIQAEDFNRSNIKTVICSSITSNLTIADAPGNLRLPARASGLSKPSVVNVSQLITVDKRFLSKKVKMLEDKIMLRIDDGIRLVLNL